MRADAIAARTEAAVASICAARPMSSGLKGGVIATPIARFLRSGTGGVVSGRVSKTIQWGDRPPSVPPDITNATVAATTSRGFPEWAATQS